MSTTDRPTIKAEALSDEALNQVLGRYKLLEKIGEGGFGVVYVAEQKEPVKRRVALKIIKLGMDTRQVVARFEAERQALALMDHPNIAKVLDAGATESGRPYFVMELVRGVKLTDYCDQNKLSTRQRLELFVPVCQAIQHAHQKGIIHRDIKPSNILVTLHDGVPVPKVIDFGIAKATQQDLTDKTVYTQLQQFVGTPAYMSPEQAEMSGLDVDTRSDIYSLGVLLYELLVGSTPFDPKELMSQGIDTMRKTIREKEPVRPSTKLATLKEEELTTTAKRRSVETGKLLHQLRGDLDWIVMKCLEKDRTRRYETANGLAMDIQRHLSYEPVVARPPSKAYRLQKAVERNKLAFVAGSAIVLALVLGIVAAMWQAVRATRAEALALQTRNDSEKLANFILDDFYTALGPSGQFDTVAGLARQSLSYYDNLPASLRTADTSRNRAMAQAQLALVTAEQGDGKSARPLAEESLAALEQMSKRGDHNEATIFAMALALKALLYSSDASATPLDRVSKDLELLRSFALSADGSTRIKLVYADLLNIASAFKPLDEEISIYEEALRVLAGLGALEFRDLSAASAWADIADSEALAAVSLGLLNDGERLEKQVLSVAQGVLGHQPANLRAREDLWEAPHLLGCIEAMRFNEENALRLAAQSHQAAEDALAFNPSGATPWLLLSRSDVEVSSLLFRQGRITEALQKARTAIQADQDPRNPLPYETPEIGMFIARWEAQRGNRSEADQALDAAKRVFFGRRQARRPASDYAKQIRSERFDGTEREVRMAFSEDEVVYNMATNGLARVEKLRGSSRIVRLGIRLTYLTLEALRDEAQAALNLGRYAAAEAAATELLSIHEPPLLDAELHLADPFDPDWARVLLAQAVAGQGRNIEALNTLEPAIARYRAMQNKGATHLTFRQHFARALYAQALAEPADNAGKARARESLDQAAAQLNALSDEAKQLHDSREILGWIEAEQKKLHAGTPQR